jgi:hypothetical protein
VAHTFTDASANRPPQNPRRSRRVPPP